MADVLRRPLEVGRRDPPRPVATVFVAGSLLLGTLAANATALPIGKQSLPLQDERPAVRVVLNADTSRGTPKTLTADAQFPARILQHTAPDPTRKQILPSTAAGTAKTLTADKQAPVGFSSGQVATPEARRSVVDTSADTPLVLLQALVAVPITNPPLYVVDWRRWHADTSQDTPKPLTADAQLPVGKARSESAPERSRWLPADTTQDSPQTVRPDAQFPARNAPFSAVGKQRIAPDTSLGFTPTDVVAPLVNSQLFAAIDKPRITAETSTSSLPLLLDTGAVVTPDTGFRQTPAGDIKRHRRKLVLDPDEIEQVLERVIEARPRIKRRLEKVAQQIVRDYQPVARPQYPVFPRYEPLYEALAEQDAEAARALQLAVQRMQDDEDDVAVLLLMGAL